DYRRGQLARLPTVEVALESRVTAGEILEYGFAHVVLATGSHWRRDGVGRRSKRPLALGDATVATPDDPDPGAARVLVYDDDHDYTAAVLAELLARAGRTVTYVTPAPRVSEWTVNTMEQHRIQQRLLELGVDIV